MQGVRLALLLLKLRLFQTPPGQWLVRVLKVAGAIGVPVFHFVLKVGLPLTTKQGVVLVPESTGQGPKRKGIPGASEKKTNIFARFAGSESLQSQ